MLRLARARFALLVADCRVAKVTVIATSFGFVELGRFSVEYRELFGESPSRTLQRAPLSLTGADSGPRQGEFYTAVGDIGATVTAESQPLIAL